MAKKKSKRTRRPSGPEFPLKNPKQELWAYLWAGYHNNHLFGNASRCYMQAYGYNDRIAAIQEELDKVEEIERKARDRRRKRKLGQEVDEEEEKADVKSSELRRRIKLIENTAYAEGSRFLSTPTIMARADYLLESYISDNLADRELLKVMVQDEERGPKVQAIREYNDLKKRRSQSGISGEITFGWDDSGDKKPVVKKVKVSTVPSDDDVTASFAS